MAIHTYIPQDRLRAIASNTFLPDRTSGSALFADISGFTALTESFRDLLGARQGAEELTKQLGAVYSALIAEVESYRGSVIGFAGDAIVCWFDSQSSAVNAVASAFGMLKAIKSFAALGLKITITSGDARRFVVGDPKIQQLDVLAGGMVARTSTAEHHAIKGDILIDEATANVLSEKIKIIEWRVDEESNEHFAVIRDQVLEIEEQEAWSPMPQNLSPDILKSWVPQAVFERETSGQGMFLTEFRPCVALFVHFTGIDYDSDSAGIELDRFICEVQRITSRHQGTLLDITIGDKGSYAYVNFGALSAHEDDSRRAVKTALDLMKVSSLSLHMGITQGPMRVGAYGGETRRSFGALGDDVNLAARLMTTATAGEILVSSHVHRAVMDQFTFEPRAPIALKGKAEPLPVFAVTGERKQRAIRLQEPTYTLPMVGRQSELQIINDKLDLAEMRQAQVIGIVAEAGMGKSRLVAEAIRLAHKKGFVGYGGACQSDGVNTPYLAWKSIWQAFFDVYPGMSERKLVRWLQSEIEDRAPDRVEAMPLLNTVLDLSIPENDFTHNLEPKIRQGALHALLEDCLKAQAKDGPILIVIEDLHWIDSLSHDLLDGLAKALANHAVCFVLAYRPPQLERLQAPRLEALPKFTKIELHELTVSEAESAVRAKLLQLYPARGSALPKGLVDTLMARAQGNPFYLEELLNYVRDRGINPSDLQHIELPDSLHTLILSRIDQLSEQEKTTLRVASIVGRLFRAKWLTGYYPELGTYPQVKAALDALEALDITPLDSPEPELAYLFKHIVTHEVTYESLPFATRARLHEQLARYLESVDASVDTITFHYVRSENKEKQSEYLRKAGEVAQMDFANDAALEYYSILLSVLHDTEEQTEIHLKRGEVWELMGKFDESERDYSLALDCARDDAALKASAQFALGKLKRMRGNYESALHWLTQAKEMHTAVEDTAGLAEVLIETGFVLYCKGELAQAREQSNEGLALARQVGDRLKTSRALNVLANVSFDQGDSNAARALYEESLSLRREVSDKVGIATSLRNLGLVAHRQGDYGTARAMYEESLALRREMGDKVGIADSLNNMGELAASAQGDYTAARALYEESLELSREIGDKSLTVVSLSNLGVMAYAQGDYTTARALYKESLELNRKIGDKWLTAGLLYNLGVMASAQGDYTAARASFEESLMLCKEMDAKTLTALTLLGLGLVDLAENKSAARENLLHSLRLRQETDEHVAQTSSLIGVAGLALQEGNPQFAAQLLGAIESALKALNAAVETDVLHFHAQTLMATRKQLGEPAFQSAWEEGSQWPLEDVVKMVLEENSK